MNVFVLDASAVLAVLFAETGRERASELAEGAMMSTVNVAETLTKCVEKDYPESDAIDFILNSNIAVIDFDLELAKLAAALRRNTDRTGVVARRSGLPGLGDREKMPSLSPPIVSGLHSTLGCRIEVIR